MLKISLAQLLSKTLESKKLLQISKSRIKRQISVDFNAYIENQKDKIPKDLLENLQKISNAYFEGDYNSLFEKKDGIIFFFLTKIRN